MDPTYPILLKALKHDKTATIMNLSSGQHLKTNLPWTFRKQLTVPNSPVILNQVCRYMFHMCIRLSIFNIFSNKGRRNMSESHPHKYEGANSNYHSVPRRHQSLQSYSPYSITQVGLMHVMTSKPIGLPIVSKAAAAAPVTIWRRSHFQPRCSKPSSLPSRCRSSWTSTTYGAMKSLWLQWN